MSEKLQAQHNTVDVSAATVGDMFGALDEELNGNGDLALERDKTLQLLIEHYGGQLFQYGRHSGTITDIINLCPVAGVVLEQGFDAMVEWIEPYAVDSIEEPPQEDETPMAGVEAVHEQENNPAHSSQKETFNTVPVIDEKPVAAENMSLTQAENNSTDVSDSSVSQKVDQVKPVEKKVVSTNERQDAKVRVAAVREAVEKAYESADTTVELPKFTPEVETKITTAHPSEQLTEKPISAVSERTHDTNLIVKNDAIAVKTADVTDEFESAQPLIETIADSSTSENPAETLNEPIVKELQYAENEIHVGISEPLPVTTQESNNVAELPEVSFFRDDAILQIDSIEVHSQATPVDERDEQDDDETNVLPLADNDFDIGYDLMPAADEETTINAILPATFDTTMAPDSTGTLETEYAAEDPVITMTEILEKTNETNETNDEDLEANSISLPPTEPETLSVSAEVENIDIEIGEILEELTDEVITIDESEYNPLKSEKWIAKTLRSVQELQTATTAEECNEAVETLRLTLRELLYALGFENADDIVNRILRQYDMTSLYAILVRLQTLIRHNATLKQRTYKHKKHEYIGSHAVQLLVHSIGGQLIRT